MNTSKILAMVLASLVALTAEGEPRDEVATEEVVFWSDGIRIAGDLFYPASLKSDEELPGIVLCHGWGGLKRHLKKSYALDFAAKGYIVLAFDYRGWGESDSRLISVEVQPEAEDGKTFSIEVRPIRELVDPLDQLEDIRNAINFIEGDARVDSERLGVWGTSLGGGLAVITASRDKRVRCVVSQVGAMDGLLVAASYKGGLKALHRDELKRTRGELDPFPQNSKAKEEGLRGTPYFEHFARFSAVKECKNITAPTMLIDVELEEMFDIRDHSGKVFRIIKDRVEAKHKIIPNAKHYDIYRAEYDTSVRLALYWFEKHLR